MTIVEVAKKPAARWRLRPQSSRRYRLPLRPVRLMPRMGMGAAGMEVAGMEAGGTVVVAATGPAAIGVAIEAAAGAVAESASVF